MSTQAYRNVATSILAASALFFAGCVGDATEGEGDIVSPADDSAHVSSTQEPTNQGCSGGACVPEIACVTITRRVIDTYVDMYDYEGSFGDESVAIVESIQGQVGLVGRRHMLIRFDLSELPEGARIETAHITLHPAMRAKGTLGMHALLGEWDEDTSYGSLGGNWSAESMGSFEVTGEVTTFDVAAPAVKWASGAPSYGVLLQAESTEPAAFWTSEAKNPALRPRMEICYLPALKGI